MIDSGTPSELITNPFVEIFLDADPATWEEISLDDVVVPMGAQMYAVRIAAIENNAHQGYGEECPNGFYADSILVDDEGTAPDPDPDPDPDPPVIPEPTRAALLLLGAFGVIARRRRK